MCNKLKCNFDGDFNILVVADPQCEEAYQWTEAKKELETLVKRTNPDFVLINGDMETNNKVCAEGWAEFIKPLTQRGICWSTTNGNHDPFDTNINKIYTNYAECLNSLVAENDVLYEKERPLNYCIPVYSNDSKKVVFAIYGMDSGTKNEYGWEGFTEKQIEWYKKTSEKLESENGLKPVTSLMCCHIPFAQIKDFKVLYGVINEDVSCTENENDRGVFKTIKERNDVKIALFGHSHKINRIGVYDDVLLGYAGKLSTGSYHDELCRGGRVIKFNQSNPEEFVTSWVGAIPESSDQPEVCLYEITRKD